MDLNPRTTKSRISRRGFLKKGASATGVGLAASRAFAADSDTLRVAAVGCGSRGTFDIITCLKSSPNVELVAVADMFQDKVDASLERMRKEVPDRVNVTPDRVFLGFDAGRKVFEMDEVDLVLLLTPPGFRPQHVAEAVRAGKHIFMEKPGAVDPVGVRSLLKSADEADRKGLSIVVGTQQRYTPQYNEIIQRIWDGQIGEIGVLKAIWICGMVDWHYQERQTGWSDMEWQIRCWPYFTWLSGDHLVEQLCHNIDVCNWIMKGTPESCMGLGGRQVRTDPGHGHIYDHFAIEYKYPGGLTMLAMAAQMHGVTDNVSNTIEGTKGIAWVTRGGARITGEKPWRFEGAVPGGEDAMFKALIESIRTGEPINECRRLAETTMTAIFGRMSTYTGKKVEYDWALNESKLKLGPDEYKMGRLPVDPVAMPGKTELI
jgi:predicted dehydrogenase